MAQRSRPTLMKREREKARMEKQKMKEARRADKPLGLVSARGRWNRS